MLTTFRTHTTILPRNSAEKPTMDVLDFELPCELEASEPPEARGLARDEVRLMVSYTANDYVEHTQFRNLPDYLQAGDVVVINTSGTMNAALNAIRADGTPLELHLSTHLPANQWIVEVREPAEKATKPFLIAKVGETLSLPDGASVTLHMPYNVSERHPDNPHTRLWIATLNIQDDLHDYLNQYGFPIRYSYVNSAWSNSYYQTVYANEMGSAEMPSAGRAFTHELIVRLVAKGVHVVPLILHTGVASLEEHEPPYEEYYRVPTETAWIVNEAHKQGRRIVAVGTTSIRALETVTDENGVTHSGEGWTGLIITPEKPIRSVNAMLTGLHEPKATHLAMLEALAGRDHLKVTYRAALDMGYLWHEFGDLHLIFNNNTTL
jgi:S-adenosylmethionine:tRNA ribosyltransferase-isomerase